MILAVDPRLLVGVEPQEDWTDERRQMTASGLSAWYAGLGDRSQAGITGIIFHQMSIDEIVSALHTRSESYEITF